jgi:hypothetical protein
VGQRTWDSPVVKGFVWFTDESRTTERLGLEFMGNIWEEIVVLLKECKLKFFKLKYMTFLPVFINFKQMLGQRNKLVLALIVRRP